MTRKKIYIAYTGGTIGMKKSTAGYVPVENYLTQTINNMPEFFRAEMPEFDIFEYSPLIDSSNMTPSDWQKIADDIARNYQDYDGFVILHGTDTMAYTASALAFMLPELTKPVIITGSQIPLSQLRSDGQVNLLNSLYIAANYPIHEVGLFFNNQLFRGVRSKKTDADGFNAFTSPNLPPLLEAGINITVNAGCIKPIVQKTLIPAQIRPQPIGMVSLYPGISIEVIRNIIQQPVKALLLLSYGVGNAPEDPALLSVLNEATQHGVIVVNLTQCLRGKVNMDGYATGNALSRAGVISGRDMTVEACLAKLHYLLSMKLSSEQIREKMEKSLVGELTE